VATVIVKFNTDSTLAEHDHPVLHLQTYYPDLKLIELIRALVKDFVSARDVSFNVNDVMKRAEEKFSSVSKEQWTASACM
jgi:hypothetical protein